MRRRRLGRERTRSARTCTRERKKPTGGWWTSWAKLPEARGVSQATLALAWMLTKPAITAPIVGATKPHHLEDAVAAVALKLTPEEVKTLEEPYVAHPVLGLTH